MRLPTRKEMPLIYWGGPTAIINTNKNNHDMIPIKNPMGGYFICEYGVFVVDSRSEYRFNKQALMFFISHGEKNSNESCKRS